MALRRQDRERKIRAALERIAQQTKARYPNREFRVVEGWERRGLSPETWDLPPEGPPSCLMIVERRQSTVSWLCRLLGAATEREVSVLEVRIDLSSYDLLDVTVWDGAFVDSTTEAVLCACARALEAQGTQFHDLY